MKRLLFITDFYYEEDLFVTSELREDFQLVICHPEDTETFEKDFDLIVFRNAGPVAYFKDKYEAF